MANSSVSKPSDEADLKPTTEKSPCEELIIHGIIFATTDDIKDSQKESNRKTELWTLTDRLKSIADMIPIPKLSSSNWLQWTESIQKLIFLSQTSAAFLHNPPRNKAITMWSTWWAAKLKESAPHVQTAPRDSARRILSEIVISSQTKAHRNVLNITARFWNLTSDQMSLRSYITEYQKRLLILREHTLITTEVEIQMKNLLLFHVTNLQPDLANLCRHLSFDDALSECLTWISNQPKSRFKENKSKCAYCHNLGHSIDECRKKKRSGKGKLNENNNNEKQSTVLSVNKLPDNSSYQLDTAADFHVSGIENDFSSYSKISQIVGVAGGGQVVTAGQGDIIFPTFDGKLEKLNGAIHLPGEKTRILSTSQLEKQGFSIDWPIDYQDVKLIRPDGSVCAVFHRESGRLIWRPKQPINNVNALVNIIKRDWHTILGHPGQVAQQVVLKQAGIDKHEFPKNCEVCTKTKITISKGHGSLRTALSFAEVIHMDLVGGQKSLSPVATDSSIPNATWFLIAIDEYTSYRWAWPVYSKKTVPTKIRFFLEYLKTKFNKTPKCLHTDGGTEFSNRELQDELLTRGIEWHRSSSRAPEQNGIAERSVRTVTEKMRALHLQSGIPVSSWPIILNASINLLNLTPNKIAPKSPFYAVFNRLPNIKQLYPFGCRAFWLSPDQNKLKSRANEGIYVGTEFSKGHIILNPQSNKTIVRRDIQVHENSFPLKSKILSLQSSNRRVIQNALSGPRAEAWKQAMEKEMENMSRNEVWTLVPRSEVKGKIMTGKWDLKEKSDGQLKARWCARGFTEPYADNTYAEVLPPTTMRMLLAYAALKNLHIRHVDVTAAFLHADIDTPIYIEQPHGKEKPGNLVCKLQKAIYGLKTAPRRWQEKLRNVLRQNNFLPLRYDSNVFRYKDIIISTYVDDFMIISPSESDINNIIALLAKAFQVKDLGNMTKFLGINIQRNSDGIHINQEDKINALCDDMGMQYCKSVYTPIADDNLIDSDISQPCTESDAIKYRSVVGSLLHIANMTRPDIQYAVNRLCRYVHNPSQNSFLALKHLVRYISYTKSATLFFPSQGKSELTASSDSSWGNITSSKGTSGILFLINNTPIAWWSKKQTVTAQSTCEAEYAALTSLSVAARWLRPLFEELFQVPTSPILTEIDNTAALLTANSTKVSARNRHFLMRESTVREAVQDNLIKLKYTPTGECKADGLTKALQRIKHKIFCSQVRICIKHTIL